MSKSGRRSPTPLLPAGSTLALALAGAPLEVAAQTPKPDSLVPGSTVRIAAGPEYEAGAFHRFFFGTRYRKLWATPIDVQVLDLDTFAGGLRATRRGGGEQTKSLRLEGADGKEYSFRSVNKDPSGALPPELRETAAADIVRDQTSASHPAGALVVAPILEALGVLHAEPRLVVMPRDSARLGEFVTEFGGMLGTIEERPEEADDAAGFAGAVDIVSTEKLLEELRKSPNDRVDARAYLTARLTDIYLGDWDRHQDQWRWARFGGEKPRRWVPIPRDRDQAMARYDGFLLGFARASTPQLVKFGPKYAGMLGQTWNGRDIDRWFLTGLERPVWDSIALALQAKLTDAVIAAAVASMPAGYQALDSARLGHALRERRDRLPEAAETFYRHLAGEVDVQATDKDELVTVTRHDGRFTSIAVAKVEEDGTVDPPYIHRRFDHAETKEVRLHLADGDDRVVVEGPGGGGIRIRVLADGGADSLANSSRGGRVKLYAPDANDGIVAGAEVKVDRSAYDPHPAAQRDWGDRWLSQTWLAYGPDLGAFFGTGVALTQYGFRRDPYAQRYRVRAGYATGAATGRADFAGIWYRENSRAHFNLLARASGIEVLRFHGFGNEISANGDNEFYRVKEMELSISPSVHLSVASRIEFSVGPLLKYPIPISIRIASSPSLIPTAPATSAGSASWAGWSTRAATGRSRPQAGRSSGSRGGTIRVCSTSRSPSARSTGWRPRISPLPRCGSSPRFRSGWVARRPGVTSPTRRRPTSATSRPCAWAGTTDTAATPRCMPAPSFVSSSPTSTSWRPASSVCSGWPTWGGSISKGRNRTRGTAPPAAGSGSRCSVAPTR